MPYSYSDADMVVFRHCQAFYPKSNILDMGAGAGKYSFILKDVYQSIEGVEIHQPNIVNFNLKSKYSKVYNCDLRNFNFEKTYDLIIMGDVLEHLTIEDSKKVLNKFKNQCDVLIIVPYMYEQGKEVHAVIENSYEEHLQPDLTKENMLERYNSLEELWSNSRCGLYVQRAKLIVSLSIS